MDIFTAIKCSNLGKYQKQIDRCNHKSGCNSCCSKGDQERCRLLKQHSDEMERVRKMYEAE